MRRLLPFALAASVASVAFSAAAADLHVATTGSDTSPGSAGSPFKTIGKCAAVATPGDRCLIEGGHYTEHVKPARSGASGKPITFAAASASGPPVILDGRVPISGWTLHEGKIWKASVPDTFGALFVDGARMVLARWPNLASGDPWHPTFNMTGADGDTTFIVDPTHLTQPAGAWDGAKMYLVPGLGWAADQVDVSAYDPTTHRIDFTPAIGFSCCYKADKESRYFLYDKLSLLDAPSEWFLDRAARVVYLWLADGGDPGKHLVEASAAPAGFDLSGLSEIRLEGLTIASGDLVMHDSTHCKVDSCRILHSHASTGTGFGSGGLVDVTGSDNLIVNSEIAYAPGRCVDLGGTRNTLTHSEVHHCDELASYDQIVKVDGAANVVSDCSLHDTGRDGIGMADHGIDGSIIEHNELFNTALVAKDDGAFYVFKTDGGGTVVRYNVVHDVWPAKTEAYGGIHLGNGIYFDDGCSNFVAHHNVVYSIGNDGIFLHQPSRNIAVYNNTTVGTGTEGSGNALETAPGSGGPDATGSVLVNNLAVLLDDRGGWCINIEGATPDHHHNGYFQASGKGRTNRLGVEATGVVGDPLFEDPSKNVFKLRAGSPMIDKGVVVAGITDGFIGAAPDLGAYEYGGAAETPGPRGAVGPPPAPPPDAGPLDASPGDGGGKDAGSDGGKGDAAGDDARPGGDASAAVNGGEPAAIPDGNVQGSCGCRVGARAPERGVAALALAALLLARRQRRARAALRG